MTPEQIRAAAGQLRSGTDAAALFVAFQLDAWIASGAGAGAAIEALPAIVAALQRPPPVSSAALGLLVALLAADPRGGTVGSAADAIVSAGALGPVVHLLGAGEDDAEAAAGLITNLGADMTAAGDAARCDRMAAAVAVGAVPALLGVLRRRPRAADLREVAALALANISSVPGGGGANAIAEAGGVAVLSAAVRDAPTVGALRSAVAALGSLAQDCRPITWVDAHTLAATDA
jgi:hypothetical protein